MVNFGSTSASLAALDRNLVIGKYPMFDALIVALFGSIARGPFCNIFNLSKNFLCDYIIKCFDAPVSAFKLILLQIIGVLTGGTRLEFV